jgi:hypothetical protein
MPSFWTECFGRVVVEAGWNGIPTLGARQGGIPEAMNGGGLALPIPARCQAMYTAMPTPAEAQPWVDAIARWLSDADAYAIAQCRARAGAAPFEPERVVTAILDRFNRLTEGFDIGQAPAGALAGTTVVHLDTSAEGLGLLHPAFRDAAWRVLRLGPGARDDAPPHRLLETVGDGCATAVQADGALCGQNAETAVITLRQISRVLEESGYAVLAMSHGVPFTRDQLKQASDRVGFQQIAMSNSTDTQFRAILSKTRRSQKDWIVLSHLFLPARQAASE